VRKSVTRMAGLIDDVMDFARARLGSGISLTLSAGEPIEPTLRQVIAEFEIDAPDRQIEAEFAITAPVRCDHPRIAQLASNLLGNALTHGAEDQPVRMGAKTTGSMFELHVANCGSAIPLPILESLFQPFYRGSHGASMKGLGLGLYISQQIAEAHHGTLDVVSGDDETRFTFRMPLSPA
jgi:sigma-B regulation protein RsbU (phosphoserine phosphatase)